MKKKALMTALLAASSLYAMPALGLGTTGFVWTASDQPFRHPATDVSYTQNVQEDEGLAAPGVQNIAYNPGDQSRDVNQPQSRATDNGEVRYISGGVGDSGMQAIDAEQGGYNLKMLFAQRGAYLADVKVAIDSNDGRTFLSATTDGPALLVKLPPGHYNVSATAPDGAVVTRHVNVSGNHLSSYVINYQSI